MRPLLVLIRWVAPLGILVIFLNELVGLQQLLTSN
jgi:hypothetical protein